MNVKLTALVLSAAIFWGGCSLSQKSKSVIQVQSTSPPLELKVKGNQIIDIKGNPVLLRGVNAASLEWSSDGEGHILETIRVAIDDWNSNIVRIPLSQDRWFGKAPEQNDLLSARNSLLHRISQLGHEHTILKPQPLPWKG